jgi:NitT/TauT family transport system substrate-binding protein
MYSLVIIAREETIQKSADSLKRFLRATVRGMKYAFALQNIEKGAKIEVKINPEVDLEAATGAAQVASRHSFTEEVTSGKVAVGQFEPERVEKSIGIYTKYLKLKKKVAPGEVYTNDLLPEKK